VVSPAAALPAIAAPSRPAEPPRSMVAAAAPAPRPAPRPPAPRPHDIAALPPVSAPAPAAGMAAHAAAPLRRAPELRAPELRTVAAPTLAAIRQEPPASSALGSALGGNRPLLAPPVPFGSAHAATISGPGTGYR
jgi:hypothetical protein